MREIREEGSNILYHANSRFYSYTAVVAESSSNLGSDTVSVRK